MHFQNPSRRAEIIGLGELTLARCNCIALQRLNASAKKVRRPPLFASQINSRLALPGSFVDKSQRVDMDGAIFKKL